MLLTADYHTHTTYSHGKGSIEQNVQAAIQKGLKRIGITDHGFNHLWYGIGFCDIVKIRKTIDELNKRYQQDIEILMGVEANLISMGGKIDIPDGYLSVFDLILVGFHKAVIPVFARDGWQLFLKNGLAAVSRRVDYVRDQNTKALIHAMDRYSIDVITHPDIKISVDITQLAKAVAGYGTALEINAHHGYLTAEYVKLAAAEHARFVISSDAHKPSDVGNFSKGIVIAEQAGLDLQLLINAKECNHNKLRSETT